MKKYLFIVLLLGVWSCSILKAEEKKLYSELYHRKRTNQILDNRTYEPYNGKVYYKKIKKKYLMGSVINGNKDGEWKTFYDNGEKESIGSYVAGNKDGMWETFYYNGEIESIGSYIAGNRDGEWKTFYDNGEKNIIETYINGKRDGKFERYYKNGVLKISGTLKNSMLDGEYKSFHENGLKWTERLYENDKIISYDREWDENGNITKDWKEDKNDGKAKQIFYSDLYPSKIERIKIIDFLNNQSKMNE